MRDVQVIIYVCLIIGLCSSDSVLREHFPNLGVRECEQK